MPSDYAMRRMHREELDLAVQWAAAEGWNPGRHDAEAFWAADPEGFFVGLLDGDPVATISIVRYDGALAFLGFYIVRPDQRGNGYGWALWQHALREVPARCIGLDGVVAQISAYERSGFVLADRNVRYATTARSAATVSPRTDPEARPMRDDDRERLLAYDDDVFGRPRRRFMETWLGLTGSVTRLTASGERITGLGVIRPAADGLRIGPLFADTSELADVLLTALLDTAPADAKVSFDVPASNAAAVALATARSMTAEFETARMYRGAPRPASSSRVFGVTTFELG